MTPVRQGPVGSRPAVSVVVPTCRQDYLADTLEGLKRQVAPPPFEVVVVENGLKQASTMSCIRRFETHLDLRYCFDSRAGLNRARNRGVQLARSDTIAFLDDDVIPAPHWLSAVVCAHRNFPNAGTIGGRTLLRFLQPPPWWLMGEFRRILSEIDWSMHPRPLEAGEWIVGANMTFTRRVYEAAGGFAEDMGMCGRGLPQLSNDETEFCIRAGRCGEPAIAYDPAMLVEHQIAASRLGTEYFVGRFYGQGRSNVAMASKTDGEDWPEVSFQHNLIDGLYSDAWVEEISGLGESLPPDERATLFGLSALCRLSYLTGLVDGLRSSTGHCRTALHADKERRYYEAGLRTASKTEPTCSTTGTDSLVVLWHALRSMRSRRRINADHSMKPGTVYGRTAFLRGLRDGKRGCKPRS